MRLKYQLFLTLLAASAVLIVIMYAVSSWRFSRGFLEYINQQEIERSELVAEQLLDRFEEEGSWQWANRQSLRRIESETRTDRPRRNREGRRGVRNNPPPRPIILADANRQVLVGKVRPNKPAHCLALENKGAVVGYVVTPKLDRVDRQFDQVFEQKQRKALGYTALLMILFSGLLSILLAGRIVKPLLTVKRAVGEISGGNYAHRVDINRRDEIGDLANNINSLGHTLEQNRDARQRWIAEISHELRTPLAVVRGEIEAVQDGVRAPDKQTIDSLHSEVLSLGRLIDDLHTLSVSDVGALDYRLDAVDIVPILSEFLDGHRDTLDAKSLSLTREFSVRSQFVDGDVQRLEQLFSNLMQNTCRYTDDGGQLHVGMHLQKSTSGTGTNQDMMVIDWFDSSPGVESAALEKLFDPLFRTEKSRNREHGGTGLGLSISKRIVEAHQGSIKAMHSSLGGLHIMIELPVVKRSV